MFSDLKNKRVLITGSTQGIGFAAAQAFARQGAKVGITSRKRDDEVASLLDQLRQLGGVGGEAEYFEGDLCHTQECQDLILGFVSRFGGLDVLINNVGGLVARRPLDDIDDTFFNQVFDWPMADEIRRRIIFTIRGEQPCLVEQGQEPRL